MRFASSNTNSNPALGTFLFVLTIFLVGEVTLWFIPLDPPLRATGMVMLATTYVILFYQSWYKVPDTRRLAAYYWSTFWRQYINGGDARILDAWYEGIDHLPQSERELADRYYRRSVFSRIGLGDVIYLQAPFFTVYRVVSDSIRMPIRATDGIWTKGTARAPRTEIEVDNDIRMRLGPDFGRLKATFSKVNFDDPKDVAEKLAEAMQPDVQDAVRRAAIHYTFPPADAEAVAAEDDINQNLPELQDRTRLELQNERAGIFVTAGLLAYHAPRETEVRGTVRIANFFGGPGAVELDISVEHIMPKDKRVRDAISDAAIAASQGAATRRKKKGVAEGVQAFKDGTGVNEELAVIHDIMTDPNNNSTFILGGEDALGAISRLLPKKKKDT